MLRKYVNSEIILADLEAIDDVSIDSGLDLTVQTERLSDKYILLEKVKREDLCDLIPFGNLTTSNTKTTNEADDDLVYEYRETIINNDPFGKYSGDKIGKIFDNKDTGWINNALKSMRNEYIKERVKYLAKYYKVV